VLPKRIEHLVPRYISSDHFWIRTRNGGLFEDIRLILIPPGQYPDERRKVSYICLLSAPVVGDCRFVIDTNFAVWFVGEARFQEILANTPEQ
jgi:hypothetical protein